MPLKSWPAQDTFRAFRQALKTWRRICHHPAPCSNCVQEYSGAQGISAASNPATCVVKTAHTSCKVCSAHTLPSQGKDAFLPMNCTCIVRAATHRRHYQYDNPALRIRGFLHIAELESRIKLPHPSYTHLSKPSVDAVSTEFRRLALPKRFCTNLCNRRLSQHAKP